jgi:hypothetical protein
MDMPEILACREGLASTAVLEEATQTKVTMLLCDSAQIADGKLYILGGGWSFVGPDPTAMAIAVKIDVPWTDGDTMHQWTLELNDEDGAPVFLPTQNGNEALIVSGEFQAYRQEGLRPGTPLDVPLVVNFGPLPLPPGGRYTWKFFVDGASEDSWEASFSTRPLPTA